ncbi:MAG: hypothetical protein AAFP19_16260, partial [Bacteroidota bacterium]
MFKNLKSLFIEEDETAQDNAPAVQKDTSSASPKQPNPSPISSDVPKARAGKVNNKFMQILLEAMEKNNLDGFDYLEFKQALQNLHEFIIHLACAGFWDIRRDG